MHRRGSTYHDYVGLTHHTGEVVRDLHGDEPVTEYTRIPETSALANLLECLRLLAPQDWTMPLQLQMDGCCEPPVPSAEYGNRSHSAHLPGKQDLLWACPHACRRTLTLSGRGERSERPVRWSVLLGGYRATQIAKSLVPPVPLAEGRIRERLCRCCRNGG